MKKTFYTATLICLSNLAIAQEIEIYSECPTPPKGEAGMCKGFWEKPGDEHSLEAESKFTFAMKAALTLNADNVKEASVTKKDASNPYNREALNLVLDSETSKKFAKFTQANIGKMIGIVYENRLLMAPMIQSEITEGRIVLGYGKDSFDPLAEVKWLREKVYNLESKESRNKNLKFFAYILLAVVAFGASLHYAFGKTEKNLD